MERKFVSWNTNGFRKKLPTLVKKFNELQADVVFMQETHADLEIYNELKEGATGWRVYGTKYDSRSKGVAILIKDNVPFKYICHDEDYSGGYIVLFCCLYGQLFTLVNVYNHNEDRKVLYRLKDYLREVAEGVLVIGGDFNTVLDPEFDRSSRVINTGHSVLRDILENFMSSLNLIDTWSHLHPTDTVGGFTRSQNSISSRLDMFFMPEDTMNRVIECKIDENVNKDKISDHHPLILTLRVQQQNREKVPNVASMEAHERLGQTDGPEKINGAEILNAIKSLTDTGEERPDGNSVDHYKKSCCPMSEILKTDYNKMLKDKPVLRKKRSRNEDERHTLSVKHVIFCQILATRLREFLPRDSENTDITKFPIHLEVSFESLPKTILWSLLEDSLKNLDDIDNAPPRDFSILKTLLPQGSGSSEEGFTLLCEGCPLTRPILTLVLKHLGKVITQKIDPEKEKTKKEKKTEAEKNNKEEEKILTKIGLSRHVLFLHVRNQDDQTVDKIIENFQIQYKIKLKKIRNKFGLIG